MVCFSYDVEDKHILFTLYYKEHTKAQAMGIRIYIISRIKLKATIPTQYINIYREREGLKKTARQHPR